MTGRAQFMIDIDLLPALAAHCIKSRNKGVKLLAKGFNHVYKKEMAEEREHQTYLRAEEAERVIDEEKLRVLLAKHPERAKLKTYLFGFGSREHALIATTSKQKAAEIAGYERASQLWNVSVTSNPKDRIAALKKPETLLVAPDNGKNRHRWLPYFGARRLP